VASKRPSVTPPLDIREVQTIKHDRVFLCCDRYGDIPRGNAAALGLYFMDTRFLSRYELRIDGERPVFLHAEADRNYSMLVETTRRVPVIDPTGTARTDNVSISRQRWVEGGMQETIRVRNFSARQRRVRIDLSFAADFLDLFEVRGWAREGRGEMLGPEVGTDRVRLAYRGLDGALRTLVVSFDPPPGVLRADRAAYTLQLGPQEAATIRVGFTPSVDGQTPTRLAPQDLEHEYQAWKKRCTRFAVSHPQFQSFLSRAVLDLRMMQTADGRGGVSVDAGVPWFSALFGRDALIASYMALGLTPELAKGTLRRLAEHQGTVVDDTRDEQPGKILHELRVGELARTGEIPHTPYYGSVDATPLWLVVYAYVWQWTADRELAEELWPNAVAALEWIDRYGDADGDGYVEYQRRAPRGLDNQGWKDSHDGILHADGTTPAPPIALVEVQGYVYDAKVGVARVARALGHADVAGELEAQAAELRRRFNRDFWMPDARYFAVALDGDKRQVASITSNPGHALWSGIVDPALAGFVVRRLLADDMSCGWGIRTLSSRNPGFDPIGYHTGTVWPHDNAICAHGMKRYGFEDEAARVIDQLVMAGRHLRDARFPELFCGFSRADAPVPVEYPVACRPQAWASAAPLLMIRTYTGMHAEAPEGRLSIVRPALPEAISGCDLIGLRVGSTRLDLSFRQHAGATAVNVVRREGAPLDVVVRY
jgi:glycogen debranching enzyme